MEEVEIDVLRDMETLVERSVEGVVEFCIERLSRAGMMEGL